MNPRRKKTTTDCPWCREPIAITVASTHLPEELADESRSPSLEDLVDVYLDAPLATESGVTVAELSGVSPHGGWTVVHTNCLVSLACYVIAREPHVLRKLRDTWQEPPLEPRERRRKGMRGADDPRVRKQAITNLTDQLIRAARELRRLGVSPEEIEARIRRMLSGDTERDGGTTT